MDSSISPPYFNRCLSLFIVLCITVNLVSSGSDFDGYIVQFRGKAPSTVLLNFHVNIRVIKRITNLPDTLWWVQTEKATVKLLGRDDSVRQVTENTIFYVNNTYTPRYGVNFAYPQHTGKTVKGSGDEAGCTTQYNRNIWGLIRCSHHTRPDYNSSGYRYERLAGAGGGQHLHTVHVYNLGTGLDVTHPEYQGRAEFGDVASDVRIKEDALDYHGLGTHAASLAAGTNVGAARDAYVVSYKVLDRDGRGTLLGLLEALSGIIQRDSMMNGSRPIVNIPFSLEKPSAMLDSVIQSVLNAGIPVVMAAGDKAREIGTRIKDVIVVGAMTRDDGLSALTGYGAGVDLYAPGVDILGANIRDPGNPAAAMYAVQRQGTASSASLTAGILARYLGSVPAGDPVLRNPAAVKAWLIHGSGKNQLTMSEQQAQGSNNRLLNMICLNGEYIGVPPTPIKALAWALFVVVLTIGSFILVVMLWGSLRKRRRRKGWPGVQTYEFPSSVNLFDNEEHEHDTD